MPFVWIYFNCIKYFVIFEAYYYIIAPIVFMKSFFKHKKKEQKQGSGSSNPQQDGSNSDGSFGNLSTEMIYYILQFVESHNSKLSFAMTNKRNYFITLPQFFRDSLQYKLFQLKETFADQAIANNLPKRYKVQVKQLEERLETLTVDERIDWLRNFDKLSEKIVMRIIQYRQADYAYISSIHFITVQASKLPKIPEALPNTISPKFITEINFDDNCLEDVPIVLSMFFELKKLNLSNNRITSIPSEVINLSNLENLNLNDNRLEKLPEVKKREYDREYITVQRNYLTKKELKKIKPFILDKFEVTCKSQRQSGNRI